MNNTFSIETNISISDVRVHLWYKCFMIPIKNNTSWYELNYDHSYTTRIQMADPYSNVIGKELSRGNDG